MKFFLDSAGASGFVGVGGAVAAAVVAEAADGTGEAGAVMSVAAGAGLGALVVGEVAAASDVGTTLLAAGCGAGLAGTDVGAGCGEVACGLARRPRTIPSSRSI